ncbi:MAG: Hsp20/alpha crystallin family protein [Thermodesulfobacteriota bacterium]|nr:Hsp20/alpha crystallin family protein [Thermodesulfobacteriota bacterium]
MFDLRFQQIMGFLLGVSEEERVGAYYPSLDVFENRGRLCIEIEIPDVDPENIEVTVLGRTLNISGKKKDPLESREIKYLRMERSFGRFSRALEIPERFDLDKIDATFRDGVLIVKIGRAELKPEIIKRVCIK